MMVSSIDARATQRGLILVVLAGVAWGTSGVATKGIYGLVDISPVTVAAFRLALGAPFLLVALRMTSGGLGVPVARGDTGLLLAVGAALGISQACYFGAIAQVGVAVATLVTICTAPVLVGLFGALLLRERLTPAMLAALACALLGTALLVGIQPGDAGTQGEQAVRGVLLALGAAVCFAVFILGSRLLAHRYHPLQSITIAVAIGGGAAAPRVRSHDRHQPRLSRPRLGALLVPRPRADRAGLRPVLPRREACHGCGREHRQPGGAADRYSTGHSALRRAPGTAWMGRGRAVDRRTGVPVPGRRRSGRSERLRRVTGLRPALPHYLPAESRSTNCPCPFFA